MIVFIGSRRVFSLRWITIIDTILFVDGGRVPGRDVFVRRECELFGERTLNALVTRFYIFVSGFGEGRQRGDAGMRRRRDAAMRGRGDGGMGRCGDGEMESYYLTPGIHALAGKKHHENTKTRKKTKTRVFHSILFRDFVPSCFRDEIFSFWFRLCRVRGSRERERTGHEVTRWQTRGVIGDAATPDKEGRQPR
jgi:hypothetical protein